MRKLPTDGVKVALGNTVKSIRMAAAASKLKRGEDVHPLNRLTSPPTPDGDITDDDLASLIAERLAIQGYVLYHDEDVAREYLSQGLARVEGLLPRK